MLFAASKTDSFGHFSRLGFGVKCAELGAGAKSNVPVDRVGTLFGIGIVKEHLELNALLTGFETLDLNTPQVHLPFEDKAFDAIFCEAMPFLRDPKHVLQEARRAIKDDGIICASWSSNSVHDKMMSPAWRALTGFGFCVAYFCDFCALIFNILNGRWDAGRSR